ncbi:MAG: HNH endonuclease [Patescibacteria group bacterium]
MKKTITPIKGFPHYFIDNLGNVYSEYSKKKNAERKSLLKMKLSTKKDGHNYISLYNNGVVKKKFVHRLVLENFDRLPKYWEECRHLNGNPADNRLENLKWGSRSENSIDKALHGKSNRGERNGQNKLKESQVIEILKSNNTNMSAIARLYGVNSKTISDIKNRKNWNWVVVK